MLSVLLVFAWGGSLGTERAHAFVYEADVINGSKLSAEAEKFLRDQTEIPKIFSGGPGEPPAPPNDALAWTDWLDGGGAMPVMASVLAFGVGTVIGSEICNSILELEGCWYFSSNEADPALAEGKWVLKKEVIKGFSVNVLPYNYCWASSGTSCTSIYAKPDSEPCGVTAKAGTDYQLQMEADVFACEKSGVKYNRHHTLQIRYGNINRHIAVHAKDEPGVENFKGEPYCPLAAPTTCTAGPSSNWSERLRNGLVKPSEYGISEALRDGIAEHIAANTPKGEAEGIKDPLAHYVKVPSCTSTWSSCKTAIEELELVPERHSLDWKTAVIEKGAGAVLTLSPSTGAEVKVASKVVVETNPDSEGMPAVVPEPEAHETYAHYIARLSPALDPTREIVSDANEDASAGPDAVLQVTPEPGTRADPASTTAVEVQTNPHDAPPVPVESGGCDASVGSIDFSPLNRGLGNRFPFGLFTWAASWLSEWPDGEEAPSWTLPIVPGGVFGGEGVHLHLAFGWLEPYIEPIRIVMLLATFVGIIWFLATAALKLQGDTS
ncbi:MAG TPA: hypothetical protein VGC63_10270 [Solirubrobacterales bacterium]